MYFGFDNISIQYGKMPVVRGFTAEIPKGQVVTLIGQNGCGKSSLLKTISRAVSPVSGRILYEDRDLRDWPSRTVAQKIGYLAQVHSASPDIDVRTLVSYGRYPHTRFGRSLGKKDREIIDRSLELTGLTGLRDASLGNLSGGELQRAWIALSLCQEPEILVLDEPTTYLDVRYQVEVLELIRGLNRSQGITILMVLHDLNLAARYSDLLYAVAGGRLYAGGTPREILTEPVIREVFQVESRICEDPLHHCPYFIPLKNPREDS